MILYREFSRSGYRIFRLLLLVPTLLLASPVVAELAPDVEVEHLLNTIGNSDCIFIRNGTRHNASNAEDHLRMKYHKARRHADNADEFIDNLASESSWTGKPYMIECPVSGEQPARQWLTERLNAYRHANQRVYQ